MEFGNSQGFKDFSFCFTRDIDLPVRVRISSLEQLRGSDITIATENLQELYVSCQLFSGQQELSLPIRTAYKSFKTRWTWNEWITLPIKYRDLPVDAWLALSLWEIGGPQQARITASTAMPLFSKQTVLKSGRQKLLLWRNVKPNLTETPAKSKQPDIMDRLEKMMRRHEENEITRVDWLDNLAFKEIGRINNEEATKSNKMFLYIDFQKFDFPLIYGDEQSEETRKPLKLNDPAPMYLSLLDPELDAENIVEAKHRRLIRSHRNGAVDRDLKPEARTRDQLNAIIQYAPTQALTSEEKDLLWKFRFYLSRDKRALTKFLKCVIWTDSVETRQAVDLLHTWAPVDIDDALELLGEGFQNKQVRAYAVHRLIEADDEELALYLLQLVQALKFEGIESSTSLRRDSKLADFLIRRGVANPATMYLVIECNGDPFGRLFSNVVWNLRVAVEKIDKNRQDLLRKQSRLFEIFAALINDLGKIDTRTKKEKSSVFKSSLQPLRLVFSCEDNRQYQAIYKSGDDLRQDQLVMQIITLMDKLLRKENLDLKLTPYNVLATGPTSGLIQFIDSMPLASILAENENNLLEYFRKQHSCPESTSTFGVHPEVMDTYVKSCAGYCVITYLLGVGDRHLDNLLVTKDGHLFHIDFGFILGRDPKPFPPPMKLAREMVDAMGGAYSDHYKHFKSYCYIAFSILRKSANLILNLFALMVDANIPDIQVERDKAVMKVQEKFRLDLSEEEAIHHFEGLINESVSALFPQVIETIHKWAQYWRK